MTPTQDPAAPPASPGGAAVGIPAGSATPGQLPAGPRTWTLELPAGMKLLNPNSRYHWADRSSRSAALKQAAWALALSRKLPHLDRVSVVVEYQPPDRRHRDADNAAAASGKPCIDGLVAAGVLEDDESPRYVSEVTYRIGPVHPGGRLVLHITEVTS
jgi:crossover junction endodeoxyribonuclease RusA